MRQDANLNKNQVMSLFCADMGSDFSINTNSLSHTVPAFNTFNDGLTGWNYWQNYYYPQIIRESYPVYIKERSQDKGKQAFEILKILQDKKILKVDKVSEFIEAMDALIKVL